MIFLNQLAQGIASFSDGDTWFRMHTEDEKRRILLGLNVLILQSGPRKEDASDAIADAQLSRTLTPCVMIMKSELRTQFAKVAWLPEPELPQVFLLLIKLLGVADTRRRAEKPLDLVNHWWHRDLSDPQVVEEIRRKKV
jgi:hypothetical protein